MQPSSRSVEVVGSRPEAVRVPIRTRGRDAVTRRAAGRARFAASSRVSSHAILLLTLVVLPCRGVADPRPFDARVVWSGAERVYIAAADSVALAPGDSLTFVHRKKNVATAVVAEVPARDLAAARLTSGSLARVRLDRVRILASRPPLRPLPRLRVGVPGRGRSSLLFACAEPRPRAPLDGAGGPTPGPGSDATGTGYRMDSLAANEYRLVRLGAAPATAPWPDTLLVRLYAVIADQEIALERGDLDLAVFWPGEASSRLRSDPRWRDLVYGARSGGALAGVAAGSGAHDPPPVSADHPALAALNAELFRGDLAPWRGDPAPTIPAPYATMLRFEVDPACPGKSAIERHLARSLPSADGAGTTPVLLFWSAAPASASPAGAVRLFTMRCPIAAAPGLRAYVRAIGADALADLIECPPPGATP